MPRIYPVAFLLLFFCSSIAGQAPSSAAEPHEFLLRLMPNTSIKTVLSELRAQAPELRWEKPKRLIPERDLWHLKYQGNGSDEALLRQLRQSKYVQLAQYNHRLTLRAPQATTPNDNLFANQWQYINNGSNGGTVNADIDADLAWDITTGGLTAQNDTIVVAVIDDGVNELHPDIVNNLWINHAEIPNNNIDDDNNGYVDDYRGWNSNANNDNIAGGNHGTPVAGVIGAEGDNSIGVAGINWNVKLMIISNNFNTTEANVLIAYGYPLAQRIRYNQTNGAEGAFVVVTNASWGLDYGTPSDAPIWCSFYDTLGKHGILNIGATANLDINVDIQGDLPTTCTSDYIIGVTNINRIGNKQMDAGYGTKSIDLGAFGADAYTLTQGSYGTFGGTSGAAPQVTGAVALLYAAACNNFIQFAKARPDQAALSMRRYILDGVKQVPSLTALTASGGYLNLHQSALLCVADCPTTSCFEPYQITATPVTDQQALLNWFAVPDVLQVQYRFREQGTAWPAFAALPNGQDSVLLTGLTACTTYEVQFISNCNAVQSDTVYFTFESKGCCEAPDYLLARTLTATEARLSWDFSFAANSYIFSYRQINALTWQSMTTSDTTTLLTGLDSCSFYEAFVQVICANGDTTNATATLAFSTFGCTNCTFVNYCPAQGINSSDDWIDTFQIGGYVNPSGNDGGYALFSNTGIFLQRGSNHSLYIRQGNTYPQGLAVWIDFNRDGDFDDLGEDVWSGSIPLNSNSISGQLSIPSSASLGITRMRVGTSWRNAPSRCGSFSYGEIEDYCVEIERNTSIDQLPSDLEQVVVAPNPFGQDFKIVLQLPINNSVRAELYNTMGQLVQAKQWENLNAGVQELSWQPDVPKGIYLLRLSTEKGQMTKRVVKY
jgi:hypothetical protein